MPSTEKCEFLSCSTSLHMRAIVIDGNANGFDYVKELQLDREWGELVGLFSSVADVVKRLDEIKPSLALVDTGTTGRDGIACTKEILKQRPETAVVIISGSDEQLYTEEAILSGACGFLRKPLRVDQLRVVIALWAVGLTAVPRTIISALLRQRPHTVRAKLVDDKHLSEREVEALDSLACFLRNKEIADRLNKSIPLTHKILRSAFEKLGVRTRAEAIALWSALVRS